MKIIYSWLKEFVDFDWSPEELSNKLTLSGLEVEGIEKVGKTFTNVVVGKIVSKEKHPNADKLSVCQVDVGKENVLQIVCGAPNVEAGQVVPIALVGALLPGNFEIKKTKIRGEESSGMICSKSELGFEEGKSAGIWVLDSNLTPGDDFGAVLNLTEDFVFEIAITANRGDCLSHLGVAREISALTGNPVKLPDATLDPSRLLDKTSSEFINIILDDPEGCPTYTGWYLIGVEAKESPSWLKNRLTWLGLRPRNVLVDVTNYVLHEVGQPLHAFDYDRLKEKVIRVKTFNNFKFTTLDSKERNMPDNSLMICEGNTPVAIAGVMGGENSEIIDGTKIILLESAYFNPSRVRKTAKRLGLSTDASYRFERGVDPKLNLFAAQRAIKMLLDLTDGKAAKAPFEAVGKEIEKRELTLRFNQVKRILGIEIPKQTILSILKGLGLELIGEGESEVIVRVPTHRHDIEREIDIIEELIRIYGLEHIQETKSNLVSLNPEIPSHQKEENMLRLILNGSGFDEILCNSMITEKKAQLFSKQSVKILNPQSEDMEYLRPSLIPGMLDVVRLNQNHALKNIKVFEIGHTFLQSNGKGHYAKTEQFLEEQFLSLVITGQFNSSSWNLPDRKSSIFDLKGHILGLLGRVFLIPDISFAISDSPLYSQYLTISSNNNMLGYIGTLKEEVTSAFDIKQEVSLAEINLDVVRKIRKVEKKYKELSKFNPVEKDMAFIVSKHILAGELIEEIKQTNFNFIKKVDIFDIYEGKSLDSALRSVGFRLTLENEEKTFTDLDLDQIMKQISSTLAKKFDAKLRGN